MSTIQGEEAPPSGKDEMLGSHFLQNTVQTLERGRDGEKEYTPKEFFSDPVGVTVTTAQ